MTKKCTSCGIVKPRSEFYPRKNGQYKVQAKCKACCALPVANEYQRQWRLNHPEQAKNAELKRRKGISLEGYKEMLENQQGGCAICGKRGGEVGSGGGKALYLAVDHSAKSGAVRGLLCTNCNLGIGSFKDNPELLRKAAEYLEERTSPYELSGGLADALIEEILNS